MKAGEKAVMVVKGLVAACTQPSGCAFVREPPNRIAGLTLRSFALGSCTQPPTFSPRPTKGLVIPRAADAYAPDPTKLEEALSP